MSEELQNEEPQQEDQQEELAQSSKQKGEWRNHSSGKARNTNMLGHLSEHVDDE